MNSEKIINAVKNSILTNRLDETGSIQREELLSGRYIIHIYPLHLEEQENYFLLDLRKTTSKQEPEIEHIDAFSDPEFFYQPALLDAQGRISSIAGRVEEKLGFVVSDLLRTPFETLVKEDQRPAYRKIFNEIYEDPISVSAGGGRVNEIELLKKNGSANYFEMTLTTCIQSACKMVAGICIDIHKRKIKEHRLENAKLKAQSSDRLKSDFLADMSHEIRTPLNGIMGFSALLDRENLSREKREKYMDLIRSSSRQLLTIVNDIIDISKIEAGQLKIVYSRVNPEKLISELRTAAKQEAVRLNRTGIRINLQHPPGKGGRNILTDEVRLRQVMINLINNALKFTAKGEITIGYSFDNNPDTINFFVRDTGSGIAKEDQKYIFDRFRQASEGAGSNNKGTGLGLAISRGIVEILGGQIGLKSEINSGSEFYFGLPLQPPAKSESQ